MLSGSDSFSNSLYWPCVMNTYKIVINCISLEYVGSMSVLHLYT